MLIAVDDSDYPLGGKPHIILAAVSFREYDKAIDSVEHLKKKYGLSEIKWNTTHQAVLTREQREGLSNEMLQILSRSQAYVLLWEGSDKQAAAQALAKQICDCQANAEKLVFEFDIGIVTDSWRFSHFLKERPTSLLYTAEFSSKDSKGSNLIQCADLMAGFFRHRLRMLLEDGDKLIPNPDQNGPDNEIELSTYLGFALRYALVGAVSASGDLHNGYFPFKNSRGSGFCIVSSTDWELQESVYKSIGIFFMGCVH